MMVFISIERLLTVKKPILARSIHSRWRTYVILACLGLGLFWSTMPLVGWSQYSLESSRTSCSIEWSSRSLSVTSYIIATFVFVFLIPLSVIVILNVKLTIAIGKLRCRTNTFKFKCKPNLRRINNENSAQFVNNIGNTENNTYHGCLCW